MRDLQPKFDFIGRAKLWFLISGVVVLVSVGSLAFRGINAGLEFRGGTAFQVATSDEDVTVADVREALADIEIEQTQIQQVGDTGFLIQTPFLGVGAQSEATDTIAGALGVDDDEINVTEVGPRWGAQITSKAIQGLVIFLLVAIVYLALRLEIKMAFAAMVALVHDMVITAGIYSLSGFEVTPATVIALLTIMGYSLYDTVVIFDRVKERTATLSAAGRVTYSQATNQGLNQVLVRSLSTSVTSLLPVGSLLFVGSYVLGASTLRELALALFLGMAAGAYSSIFVAAPVLALWKEREERWSTLRARIAARTGEPVTAAIPSTPAPPPPPPPSPPAGEQRPPSSGQGVPTKRPRQQQRRKRRKHGR